MHEDNINGVPSKDNTTAFLQTYNSPTLPFSSSNGC